MDIGEIETGILQSVRLTHAEVLLAAGESEAAGVLAREVLETAAGESSEAARRGRALLARLEAAERPEEALRRLETVLAGRPPEALGERAHLTRLEILLDIGRPAEAHREREGLATTPIQDLAVRLRLDLASARLEDLRGDPETARRRFDLVIVEAQEAGLLPLALEARARRALLEEDTKTGLRHFDEALEQAEALGLGHLVGVLRALDARTTPPGDQ
jgi:tetratricopeptide (TPR) repeat protein